MIRHLFDRYVGPVLNDKDGVSSLEYAVLAVAIIGAVIAAVAVLRPELSTVFGDIGNSL